MKQLHYIQPPKKDSSKIEYSNVKHRNKGLLEARLKLRAHVVESRKHKPAKYKNKLDDIE